MKQVILFLLFFVQVAVFGQKQVKNADKAFQKESYITASKIYEDALKNGAVTPEHLRNLGDSYYYNARYAEAAPWYAKLFQLSNDQSAEYYYRYAQSLKSAQLMQRSDSLMSVFCAKFPTEIRAKNYLVKQQYFFENNPFLAIRLTNLEINTAYSDYGATIHGDSIYFASARPEILDPEEYERTQQPYTNLFVAKFIDTTVNRSKMYDNGKNFSIFHESTPTFTSDGKTMYYTKNQLTTKNNKILVNGRYRLYKSVFVNGKWIDKGVVNIKTNDSCRIAHPALSPDNKRLYFSSDMKGTHGQSDIFYVDLYENDSVSLPVNLGVNINTEGRDSYPFVSQDNQLFFASEGHPGLGGFDVFVIDLNTHGATPKNLAIPINSVDDDFAFVWKKSQYKAVLTSNRLGGKGDDDIYAFALPKPIEQIDSIPTEPAAIVAMGKITDEKTGAALANSTVVIKDATGKVVSTVITDAEGNYSFPIVAGQTYQLVFTSNGNDSVQQTLSVPNKQTENITVDQQLPQLLADVKPTTPVITDPIIPVPVGTDLAKVFKIKPIYFDLNKALIRPDAAKELDKIVAILNENPTMEIELGSHTDCRSTIAYNQWLSDERAKASAAYIKARISNPERITGKGYGESQLLNGCACEGTIKSTCSEAEHQKNRRTEFKVIGYNGATNSQSNPLVIEKPTGAAKPELTNQVSNNEAGKTVGDKSTMPIEQAQKQAEANVKTAYPAGFVVGADLTKLLQINMIYFDLDKYNIRPDAAKELDKILAVMNQYPNMKIELASHTDCRMPLDYNQRLSNNRAIASKAYLVSHGIQATRINGKGYGETQLAVDCPCEGAINSTCTEAQHQLNRRTEFIIISL